MRNLRQRAGPDMNEARLFGPLEQALDRVDPEWRHNPPRQRRRRRGSSPVRPDLPLQVITPVASGGAHIRRIPDEVVYLTADTDNQDIHEISRNIFWLERQWKNEKCCICFEDFGPEKRPALLNCREAYKHPICVADVEKHFSESGRVCPLRCDDETATYECLEFEDDTDVRVVTRRIQGLRVLTTMKLPPALAIETPSQDGLPARAPPSRAATPVRVPTPSRAATPIRVPPPSRAAIGVVPLATEPAGLQDVFTAPEVLLPAESQLICKRLGRLNAEICRNRVVPSRKTYPYGFNQAQGGMVALLKDNHLRLVGKEWGAGPRRAPKISLGN